MPARTNTGDALHFIAMQDLPLLPDPDGPLQAERDRFTATSGSTTRGEPATLVLSTDGLYCPAGRFHIDPWRPVRHALITHAHADHARRGSELYECAAPGLGVLAHRMQAGADIRGRGYGQPFTLGDATVSFHPAGHLLGSAQVRVEVGGHVTVVTGDYKTELDPTCDQFTPVACDELITECTFGLPIYRWPDPRGVMEEVNAWWRECAGRGRSAVVFAYALGKAQRVLAGLDASIGPILMHGAVSALTDVYRRAGVTLPPAEYADADRISQARRGGGVLVIAPPSTQGTAWLRKFGATETAMASGWMRVRGRRRFRPVDRGFVLSDHVDWPALLETVRRTGATRIGYTHGYTAEMARYTREVLGLEAYELGARPRVDEDEAA